jgi:hypothetical protein
MARTNPRTSSWRPAERSEFDQARDELFSQITRCRVGDAQPEHRAPWFDDAIHYLHETYPGLSRGELDQLRQAGEHFAAPAKSASRPQSA